MGAPDPPPTLLGDDLSGVVVGGMVTAALIAFAVGAVAATVTRAFGRRDSTVAAGTLCVLGFLGGPAMVIVASLLGGFATCGAVFDHRSRARAGDPSG